MNERPGEVEVVGWDEESEAGRLTLKTSDGATYEVAPSAPEVADLAIGSRLDEASLAGLGFAAARKTLRPSRSRVGHGQSRSLAPCRIELLR